MNFVKLLQYTVMEKQLKILKETYKQRNIMKCFNNFRPFVIVKNRN